MSKANKDKMDKRQFYKGPMVLQIRLYNAPYDEIVHTQKKPKVRSIGDVKYVYIIDDYGNMHDFRADTVLAIHSWKKSHYTTIMKRMKESEERAKNPHTDIIVESGPVEEVITTPEGEKVTVPTFKSYVETEEDGIWPTEEK